jgi:hypothetical protein
MPDDREAPQQPAAATGGAADDLRKLLVSWAFPLIATLFLGGAGQQVYGGRYYGAMLFSGMETELSLSVPNQYLLGPDLLSSWSTDIFWGFLRSAPGPLSILPLLLLLLLMAHVVYKPSNVATQRPAGSTLVRLYLRFYIPITLLVLLALVLGVFTASRAFWLVALAIELVLPAFMYVYWYRTEAQSGRPQDRYALVSVLVLMVIVLIGMPYIYGRRVFDLQLRPVLTLANHEPAENTFVFDEQRMILGRVTPKETGFTIELIQSKADSFRASRTDVSLRHWVQNYRALPAADSQHALVGFQRQLSQMIW